MTPEKILLLVEITGRLARYVESLARSSAGLTAEEIAAAKSRGDASDQAFDRAVEDALQRLRGDV